VRVNLGNLSPSDVSVELYADAVDGGAPTSQPMTSAERIGELWVFSAAVPASRPAGDFTRRVIPLVRARRFRSKLRSSHGATL